MCVSEISDLGTQPQSQDDKWWTYWNPFNKFKTDLRSRYFATIIISILTTPLIINFCEVFTYVSWLTHNSNTTFKRQPQKWPLSNLTVSLLLTVDIYDSEGYICSIQNTKAQVKEVCRRVSRNGHKIFLSVRGEH